MRMVPVIKSSDLRRSLRFYTEVLHFKWKWPEYAEAEIANGVADLTMDGAELQLSRHAGDGVFGSLQRIYVDDVNERYVKFRSRGLDTTLRPESPVHTAPVDQTWGLREFSVTDPVSPALSTEKCRFLKRLIGLGQAAEHEGFQSFRRAHS